MAGGLHKYLKKTDFISIINLSHILYKSIIYGFSPAAE